MKFRRGSTEGLHDTLPNVTAEEIAMGKRMSHALLARRVATAVGSAVVGVGNFLDMQAQGARVLYAGEYPEVPADTSQPPEEEY